MVRDLLPSKCNKHLMQMSNNFKSMSLNNQWLNLMGRCLGLKKPKLRDDETNVVLTGHTFFRIIQQKWVLHQKKYKKVEITEAMEYNLEDGGVCCIFELMFKFKKAMMKSKQYNEEVDRMIQTMRPDFMLARGECNQKSLLEFTCLKIVNKVSTMGKDLKQIFDTWDIDKSGFLDASEIIKGVKQGLGICLSKEELYILTDYLDKDGDARVTYQEFS